MFSSVTTFYYPEVNFKEVVDKIEKFNADLHKGLEGKKRTKLKYVSIFDLKAKLDELLPKLKKCDGYMNKQKPSDHALTLSDLDMLHEIFTEIDAVTLKLTHGQFNPEKLSEKASSAEEFDFTSANVDYFRLVKNKKLTELFMLYNLKLMSPMDMRIPTLRDDILAFETQRLKLLPSLSIRK